MRRFHVVAITSDLAHTLAVHTSGGWLLPWFDDDRRFELPAQLHATLRRFAASAEMVHEAPIAPDTSSDLVQASCVAVVSGPWLSSGVAAVSNSTLLASPALIPRQRRAWLNAIQRLKTPVAPFDTLSQISMALDWARAQIASRADATLLSATRHRCARHEYVVRLDTNVGTMYFKGGRDRVEDEGAVTELLWELSPRHVPETLVIDHVAHRWVYRELPGKSVTGSLLNINTVAAAAQALADLQKRTMEASTLRQQLSGRCMNGVKLFGLAEAILDDIRGGISPGVLDNWDRHRSTILERCAIVDTLSLPLTLVLSDLRPENLLLTRNGIAFIDLEESYWSYPFLPLWHFAHRVDRAMQVSGVHRPVIEKAFVDEWADVIRPEAMRSALSHLDSLGRLFALLLVARELKVERRELGDQLPMGYRAARILPYLQRLLNQEERR